MEKVMVLPCYTIPPIQGSWPHPKHVQIFSLRSLYRWQAGGGHSTEMSSCYYLRPFWEIRLWSVSWPTIVGTHVDPECIFVHVVKCIIIYKSPVRHFWTVSRHHHWQTLSQRAFYEWDANYLGQSSSSCTTGFSDIQCMKYWSEVTTGCLIK